MPSVWCPGCGIGIVVNTFLQTLRKLRIPPDGIRLVSSGISCTGKIPDYLRLGRKDTEDEDVFRTALHLKQERPELQVVAFANDNDLIASGGDGLLALLESGENVLVVYINSYVYHVIMEHRCFKGVPFLSRGAAPVSESPFNIPRLAEAHGAAYVARWTPLHCRRISLSLKEALTRQGPSLVEVIVPCLMYFASEQGNGTTLDRMDHYLHRAVIRHREPTDRLDTRNTEEIIIGTFVDR